MQMLMGPQMIVPNPKQPQGHFKLFARVDFPALRFSFRVPKKR
jgi:hypothetical protein